MNSVEQAEYKATMSSLALVCRFFCAESLPRVFRSMVFSGMRHGTTAPSYSTFCRQLIAGEKTAYYLGQHVKDCTLNYWMKASDASQWVYKNFLKLYVKAIPRFANLQTLRFHDVPLDFQFLFSLKDLKMLENLSISHCALSALTDPKFTPSGSLSIKRFEFLEARGDQVENVTYDDPLSQLVASPSLHTLHTNDWLFFVRFMRLPVDFSIKVIHAPLHVSSIAGWEFFLNATPSITEICITKIISLGEHNPFTSPLLTLQKSSLPYLNTLKGPTCLITQLVPGRPLTNVQIDCITLPSMHLAMQDATSNEHRTISALERTTGPITVLRVPANVYLCRPLDSVFPQLGTLTLDITEPEAAHRPKMLENACLKWPKTPPIRSLYFNVWAIPLWLFDLPLQLRTLSAISTAFPTARKIRLCETVEWRRQDERDAWQPVLMSPAPPAHSVYALLKTMLCHGHNARVKDSHGVLARLFDPTSEADALYLRNLRALPEDHGAGE
ncbi:hypothetical protein FIBSPDRAFT_335444 [Athelia psychrophila]|uniref:F-box domain-containing protein n=1 Tax=Athelia psychrophila TaxID=1759441 RepID=A0A166Q795_9AGAM|nr:hypothetical protein FIBSPDRAFT_335444 [Fibularhizoctonia sp. CBS 109695]